MKFTTIISCLYCLIYTYKFVKGVPERNEKSQNDGMRDLFSFFLIEHFSYVVHLYKEICLRFILTMLSAFCLKFDICCVTASSGGNPLTTSLPFNTQRHNKTPCNCKGKRSV